MILNDPVRTFGYNFSRSFFFLLACIFGWFCNNGACFFFLSLSFPSTLRRVSGLACGVNIFWRVSDDVMIDDTP